MLPLVPDTDAAAAAADDDDDESNDSSTETTHDSIVSIEIKKQRALPTKTPST